LSYGEGYGYDVVKALGKLPEKELGEPDALKKVVEGLQKGNLVPVTYVKGGNEEKVVAAADGAEKAGVEAKVENRRTSKRYIVIYRVFSSRFFGKTKLSNVISKNHG